MTLQPPRPRRRSGLFALAALALALLGGCRSPSQSLTLPISSWAGYEYFYLAKQLGLDRAERLDLQLRDFPDPQDIVHAYLRGELPIAQLTTVEAVDLCDRVPKRCPVVVLVLDESLGADQVLVRRSLEAIASLRGRPVAVTPSTLGPYVLSRALEKHGLSLEQVQIKPMPLTSMADSLRRGEVDAAALFPPFSDEALRGGQVRSLFSSREIPGEIFDVLVVEPSFLAAQPAAIARLLKVWQRAHSDALRHSDAAIALMARREGVTPQEFRHALEGIGFHTLAEQQPLFVPGGGLERNLKALQRVQVSLGLLMAGGPRPRVDGAPLDRAIKEMGAGQ